MTLTEKDKRTLAAVARAALAAAVRGEAYAPPAPEPEQPALLENRGCFVTLKTDDQLRGCIGCFTSPNPLYQTIAEYTRASALEDPRFRGNRIREAELQNVAMDISCLTPLAPCPNPENIILGTHGVYVRANGRAGCFLPQVATETGWSVEEFWGHCCRDKAGLSWDAWTHPATDRMTFTADVFDA